MFISQTPVAAIFGETERVPTIDRESVDVAFGDVALQMCENEVREGLGTAGDSIEHP